MSDSPEMEPTAFSFYVLVTFRCYFCYPGERSRPRNRFTPYPVRQYSVRLLCVQTSTQDSATSSCDSSGFYLYSRLCSSSTESTLIGLFRNRTLDRAISCPGEKVVSQEKRANSSRLDIRPTESAWSNSDEFPRRMHRRLPPNCWSAG